MLKFSSGPTNSRGICLPLSGRRTLFDQSRPDGVHRLHQFVLGARGALERQRHVPDLLHHQAEERLLGARREQEVVIPVTIEGTQLRIFALLGTSSRAYLALTHVFPSLSVITGQRSLSRAWKNFITSGVDSWSWLMLYMSKDLCQRRDITHQCHVRGRG